MIEQIQSLLNSSIAVTLAVATVLASLVKVLHMLGKAVDLHDQLFVRRKYKRILDLHLGIPEASGLHQGLNQIIHLEAFYISFGVRASPLKAAFLLKLYGIGYWSSNQIKKFSRYVRLSPSEGKILIDIKFSDKLAALVGLIAGFFIIIIGGVFWVFLIVSTKSIVGYLAGVGIFLASAIIGGLFAAEYNRYKTAVEIKSYIQKNLSLLKVNDLELFSSSKSVSK